jgi:hypothetical protein
MVSIDVTVASSRLQIRAARALWLRWDVGKIYFTRNGQDVTKYGLYIESQSVAVDTASTRKAASPTSLRFPSITAVGQQLMKHDYLSATIDLGFFTGILKPAVLDRLLSLHQRLGSDVLQVVQDYRSNAERKSAAENPLHFDVNINVEGIRFGLRADDISTTLLFEALALRAHVIKTETIRWQFYIDHLGLSLGHLEERSLSVDTEPMRKSRSAYASLNLHAEETPGASSCLNIALNKVHTVMHVGALAELTDLFRSWSADIVLLRDNIAAEVAEVKENTSKVIRKLEYGEPAETSWFASRLLNVDVTSIGIAIPLIDEAVVIDSQEHGTPALLFSVRHVGFSNRRNEAARFIVQHADLRFISKWVCVVCPVLIPVSINA